jgi:para-aminobenzoate synthetase component 2
VTRILVIDNYDSFVYNLVQYLGQFGAECLVYRNDAVTVDEAMTADADGILVSPGPGVPEAAGISVDLIKAASEKDVPVLGVCLGHQAIGVAFGATVYQAPELLHGKTSEVHHAGVGVFAGLPDPVTTTRYHSLAISREQLPATLDVTAWTDSGLIMGVRHRDLPVEGVQFHPESVLTQGGHLMLANWLAQCGATGTLQRAAQLANEVEGLRLAAFGSGPAQEPVS